VTLTNWVETAVLVIVVILAVRFFPEAELIEAPDVSRFKSGGFAKGPVGGCPRVRKTNNLHLCFLRAVCTTSRETIRFPAFTACTPWHASIGEP
jgi:hypothetical protein